MTRPLTRSCGAVSKRILLSASAAVCATLCGNTPALGYDLFVRSAAVDQPRINVAFARPSDPTNPLVGEGVLGGESIQVQAYYDTGASGIVLSENTAQALGIGLQEVDGQPVVFSDVAPGGLVPFNVSEPVLIRLAPSLGIYDSEEPYVTNLADPSKFTTVYQPGADAPVRMQIGPIGGSVNPLLGDLNVVGVPAMQNKIVVMDPRPTNNFATLLDDDPANDNFDAFMRTYVYDASGNLTGGSDTLLDPGVPQTNVSISLSYADFSRFTQLDPATATPPSLAANPFIGPNPLLAIDPEADDPANQPPPVTMRLGDTSTSGSFLLDTGAAASFLSTHKAADLGIAYDPAAPAGSESPRLTGVSEDRQFTLALSGISGEVINIAGFYADSLTLPTDAADPANPDDARNLHYQGAPVLVFDIEVEDPLTGESLTLDGILGMNYFTATADILQIPGEILPLLFNETDTPFDWVVFDHGAKELRLALADPIPEPGAGVALLGAAGLLLRRRRA